MHPAGVHATNPGRPLTNFPKFRRIHSFQYPLRINLRRQRQLHQNAIHCVVGIQSIDQLQQLLGRHAGCRGMQPTRQANLHASCNFRLHIKL
jgi:hypothetical protein